MDLIDELLERDAGTVNSTIIGKLIWEKLISFVYCATSRYIYIYTHVCPHIQTCARSLQPQTKSAFAHIQ